MTTPMTNTNLEAALRHAYFHREQVQTPLGAGMMTRWERFYEIPGLLDEFVDEIEVLLNDGGTYQTSDFTTITVKE